ncbi:MAG TPA: DnaA/Hda family protein [Gemmatimonadales bacterium]|nr:DnaA/Hda family protein [Gemmatimonadales bacterium]
MTRLHPLYRFDTLVVGTSNRLAVTAARAVAEAPGGVYNPLFVYARPGLGKTHLLMATGHAANAIDPALVVEYLTLDAFVEAYRAAIAAGQGDAYRRRYAEIGVLLVDDVQFLAGQREAQTELLRLVDAMQTAGRQIVLTSDRPPAEIESLDDRLIRRFAGGLVIDIGAPDYETRVAILRRKSVERKVELAPGVIEAVAELEIDNVRELIGTLNRLAARQAAGETLDAARAVALLGRERPARSPVAVPAEPVPVGAGALDEFSSFLSEISATVSQQIEAWRAKIGAAILRFGGDGYRTQRLEQLLEGELDGDPEETIRAFESDVRRLEALRAEAAELAPDLAATAVFRDPGAVADAEAAVERAKNGTTPAPQPSPVWQLTEFVEGPGNRIAVQAAHAVIAEPGHKYNPLVMVGGNGVGKTHLLNAIGNALCGGGSSVACIGGEEFTAELIDAIEREAIPQWRARYRRADAFLLDDVQRIAGKDRSQDELFLLFNLLLESGRQLVFTSAVQLSALANVEPRLLTRLEGGLVVELPAPDRETRLGVIDRLLGQALDAPDPELAAYLAGRPADSIRAVQGVVQRVLQAAEAQQERPTAGFARTLLEGTTPRAPRRTSSRASGIMAPGGGTRSREKMVLDWPAVADRLHEEWR